MDNESNDDDVEEVKCPKKCLFTEWFSFPAIGVLTGGCFQGSVPPLESVRTNIPQL